MTITTFTKQTTSLPVELIDHVLSHLSPRHLVNAALVSQLWYTLARRQLNQSIYIHSNRQYTRWLESLETANIEHRQLVRRIVIHPQVHLDLSDLPLLQLCPWVESFDIGTNNNLNDYYGRSQGFNINDIIGRRSQYPHLLHHWRHLKRLQGYHNDSPTSWASPLHSQLTSLVCSYDDICELSTLPGDSSARPHLSYSGLISIRPQWVFSDLVELHLTFGCSDMSVTTLEIIHTVFPALEHLKLHVQSIHGTTTSRTTGSRSTIGEHGGTGGDDEHDYPVTVAPVYRLKSLSLCDMTVFDPGCYSYLLYKYPHLATLHLGFAFDEFYISPLGDNGDDDLCAYLQKTSSDLFGLISGYKLLNRLEIHLQGASEYITSLWPREQMEKWMQCGIKSNNNDETGSGKGETATRRTCGLQHLEMTYQRQLAEGSNDILGLNGMINSWVGQNQLHTLLLDVYNSDRNKYNSNDLSSSPESQHPGGQNSLQSTLDLFLYSDHSLDLGTPLLRNLTTLCIKCIPGFDISLACLLDSIPDLRILDLSFGNFIHGGKERSTIANSSYRLQQLKVGYSSVVDTANFIDLIQHRCQRLTTLCLDTVVLEDDDDDDGGDNDSTGYATAVDAKSKKYTWDLSDRGLARVWIKYLSLGGSRDKNKAAKDGMVTRFKVHEATANRSTWYNTSMAQGTHGSSKPFRSSDHELLCVEEERGYLENGGANLELKCYFVEDILFC